MRLINTFRVGKIRRNQYPPKKHRNQYPAKIFIPLDISQIFS